MTKWSSDKTKWGNKFSLVYLLFKGGWAELFMLWGNKCDYRPLYSPMHSYGVYVAYSPECVGHIRICFHTIKNI